MSDVPPLPPPLPASPRPWAQRCSWASAGVGLAVAVASIAVTPLIAWAVYLIAPEAQFNSDIATFSLLTSLLPIVLGIVLAVRTSTRWIGIWSLIFLFAFPIILAGVCFAMIAGMGGIGG